MVTAVEQAKRGKSADAKTVADAVIQRAASSPLPGFDPMDFVRGNRIQVKNGSLFIDPYLVIHPRELKPENEAQLRQKLQLTYSINNPSFYESEERLAVALNLGQLVPISLAAQHGRLTSAIQKYNAQVDSGVDADLKKLDQDNHHPFAAIVQTTLQHPARDPVGIEMLKNGLSLYLLMREKLTSLGYMNRLTDYVARHNTPDQVLGELADKIGVSPTDVRTAALKGGIEGVAQLLKLDPAYVADVRRLTEYAASHELGYNIVEHWHLGRQLLGIQAPLEQKIATGMQARIDAKIQEYRNTVRHQYDVPVPVKAEEKRIAEALNLVEPIQRALMYKLGYEICYTPDIYADSIAKFSGVYGLHRKAANDINDLRGTYRIYFSGRGDLKASMRTMVHEIAHNIWPGLFTAEDVKKIDTLAASDQQRFAAFNRIVDEKFPEFEKFLRAYQAGNEAEKIAVIQSAKAYFAPYGVSIDEGLLPYLRDANDFRFMVKYAVDTLSINGARYTKSGYDSPHERFREVLSRFAELKQVEYRGEPQLLHFLAPGLDQIWETNYIPHLKHVYQQIVAGEQKPQTTQGGKPHRDEAALNAAQPCLSDQPSHVVERTGLELQRNDLTHAAMGALGLGSPGLQVTR